MDPEQAKAAIEALRNNDQAAALAILEAMVIAAVSGEEAAESPPADPLAASAEPAPPSPEEKALETALTILTGAAGPAERVVFLTSLIDERVKHAEKVASLELSSRLELVGELVKMSVEFPATAFDGDPKDRKLKARLLNEPLPELRARVATHKAAGGKPRNEPPARGAESVVTLSALDAANAKKAGMTAEQFTAAKQNAVKRA